MKRILILFTMMCLIFDVQARCRIPKEHVVCLRQCSYNPYGPGAHCHETCTKTKVSMHLVSDKPLY